MIHKLLALALATSTLAPAQHKESTLSEQASGIARGALVEVKFNGKEKPHKMIGRFQQADQEGLEILVPREDTVDTLNVAFADMKSLKVLTSADDDAINEARSSWSSVRDALSTFGSGIVLGLLWLTSGG